MANKTHVYDGSNWRTIKKIHIYDGSVSSWQLVKYSWVYDGTAWRQVHTNAFIFNKTFAVNETDYDLMNAIVTAGWNGTDDIEATVTVNPGVTVYSTVEGTPGYGMRIAPSPSTNPGKNFPPASIVTLNVNGEIVGKGGTGGNGGTTTFSSIPNPSPFFISGVNVTATVGSAGSAGSPGLLLGRPIVLNLPSTGRIKGGGGGGGGGGAAYTYFPSSFPASAKVFYGARAPGGGGGGGAHGGTAGSSSTGGIGEDPTPYPGSSGGTNPGAGGPSNPQTASPLPGSGPGPITATGGAGGAGGAAGSSGSTGSTSTTSANPTGVVATRAGGSGGGAGKSVSGYPLYISPGSVITPTSLVGPTA